MSQGPRNGTKFGAYTLNRLIARGGMGEVYEAYESKLERRVALKLIAPTDPNEHDQDELIRRFMQEARTLAKVNHPNIVTIFSIDNMVDVPFIAMEYVDGVAFRDLIEQFTFTADGAAPLFLQLCEGVKCLHDNEIIHRDLKPHNVLLRRDGQVKILDFGIAKAQNGSNDHTRAGVVVGTLPYMPPEVKSGAPASPRSDIWSMGAIFFECLTGDRLVSAQAEAPKGVEVPFTAAEVQRIPAEMRAIITKMCAARPAQRYQGVGEVIEELRKFRQARPGVPAATWEILTQKVDEIATANRAIADTEEPRVKFTQLLAKASRDDHTPVSGEIRDITGERLRAQAARHNGALTGPVQTTKTKWWVVPLVAVAVAGAFVLKVGKKIELPGAPVAPTAPVATEPLAPPQIPVKPVDTPAPAPAARPATAVGESEAPRLTEPADGKVAWLEADQSPTFAWSRLLDAGEYRFELAGDRQFRDMRVSEPVTGGSYRPARGLESGTYFWRLSAQRRDLATAGPSRLEIHVLKAVTLLAPADEDRVSLKPREDGASLTFKWNCLPKQHGYQIEITAFGNPRPLVDQVVTGCDAAPRRINPGSYRWRVRPEVTTGQPAAPWSLVRTFTVEAAPANAPTVISGATNSAAALKAARPEKTLEEPKLTEAASTTAAGQSLDLRWSKVKGARSYVVQISNSRDFSRALVDEKINGTTFKWAHVAAGRSFWRVAAISGNDQGPFSERGTIDANLAAPTLDNKYHVKNSGFDFPAIAGAERYLIQVARTRDLAQAQTQVTTRPHAMLDEAGGTYYVRVAAANGAGEAISSYSNLTQVDVAKANAFAPPPLLTPPNRAHAPSRGGRISIIFSWERAAGADGYVLELSNDENFRHVIERKATAERGAVYKQVKFSGRVFWRVRAKGPAGLSDWSKPFYFDVD